MELFARLQFEAEICTDRRASQKVSALYLNVESQVSDDGSFEGEKRVEFEFTTQLMKFKLTFDFFSDKEKMHDEPEATGPISEKLLKILDPYLIRQLIETAASQTVLPQVGLNIGYTLSHTFLTELFKTIYQEPNFQIKQRSNIFVNKSQEMLEQILKGSQTQLDISLKQLPKELRGLGTWGELLGSSKVSWLVFAKDYFNGRFIADNVTLEKV